MGKPQGKMITFRTSEAQAAELAAEAKAAGVTRTDLIMTRLFGGRPVPERVEGKAYRPCRFHPDGGAQLVNRRWMCRVQGCPEVLS
jgi:hypothetical protein